MSPDRTATAGLAERYQVALEAYLSSPDEAGRLLGYELGRHALGAGLGILELAAAHRGALEGLLAGTPAADAVRLTAPAWEFFTEAAVPFEMSLCGFREANVRLRSTNETLERRTHELERARSDTESERATLAAVVASIGDGLLVFDADGKARLCNERAGELLAIARQELLGRSADYLRELLATAADDGEQVHDFFDRTLPGLDTLQSLELRTTGPARRDLLLELFPLHTPDGEGVGIVLRDLTAQRELDRTKDELVAVVSHELRSPLTAVSGFAELLLTQEHPPEERTRHLTTILQEARRLGTLIDDFLDLQRLDRGADRVEPVPTDLRPLLQRAAQASPEQQHPFVLDLPSALPAVLVDSERLWQVLVNLLGNARKYSPRGGEIRLAARPLDAHVEISVSDQGLGIPVEALSHLFDDFYRVAGRDREGIRGTGLGLSISRKIIHAHGGRIWAESDGPGHGSRFSFTLPRAES